MTAQASRATVPLRQRSLILWYENKRKIALFRVSLEGLLMLIHPQKTTHSYSPFAVYLLSFNKNKRRCPAVLQHQWKSVCTVLACAFWGTGLHSKGLLWTFKDTSKCYGVHNYSLWYNNIPKIQHFMFCIPVKVQNKAVRVPPEGW